ncbi:N-acetylmuramoyl-L-alanine amidase [Modestobacter sp. I12A-02662]|uniref:peptidoglycan recognition protein family protein n=1 Tax=Modestobacter sp. I12A-02662 TaxID=1730496 RepID=UPI0034DF6B5D
MARMPGAVWDPLAGNWSSQPRMTAHDVICIHTMVGSLEGTDSYFTTGNGAGYLGTESHYGTGGSGEIRQWQDTAHQADANLNGNSYVISVENADRGAPFPNWDIGDGSQVPPFTEAQIEADARILAWESSPAAHAGCPSTWTCRTVGIPLQLIPNTRREHRGVGYHRQGIEPWLVDGGVRWSNATGKVCPGNARVAQIPRIVERARQIRAGVPTPIEEIKEFDMAVLITAASSADGRIKRAPAIHTGLGGFIGLGSDAEIRNARAELREIWVESYTWDALAQEKTTMLAGARAAVETVELQRQILAALQAPPA